MDSLTQIVLGAAVGEVVLGRKVGNKAMLWGAIAGTLPDLDVYERFFFDSLTANELHRGITHSLLFSLGLAPIMGWLIKHREKGFLIFMLTLILGYPFLANDNLYVRIGVAAVYVLLVFFSIRNRYDDSRAERRDWNKLVFWALVTHPLLDCHTTWGTQFLWPLPYKLAWNNIFVVDPAYTIPFLVLVAVAMFFKRDSRIRQRLNWAGIFISSAYMVWTLGVKWHVHRIFTQNLKGQHIDYTRLTTHPTPFNSILWMGSADGEDHHYVGLYSLLDSDRIIHFDSIATHHELIDSLQGEEVIKRLRFLSKDWYAVKQEKDDTLTFYDGRFGPFYIPGEPVDYVFGYYLYEEEGVWKAHQMERPTGRMSDAMKALFDRMGGD